MTKRDKVLTQLNKTLKVYKAGKAEAITWDANKIQWEDSFLSDMYHDNIDAFYDILDKACKGLGCFIELDNSCIGTIVND